MAIYTAATFGVPAVTDTVVPYIPADSGGANIFGTTFQTNILLDGDALTGPSSAISLTGGVDAGLTIQNAIVTANGITSAAATAGVVVLNSRDTVYNIMFTGSDDDGRQAWNGIWRFNGDRFIRRTPGGRYQLGFFTGSVDWSLFIGERGLDLNSYGDGAMIMHMAGLTRDSIIQGLRFDGLALAQVNDYIPQFGFSPSNAASMAQAALHPDLVTEWGLNTRLIPGADTAGILDADANNPNKYVMYSGLDLSGALAAGRVGGAEFNDAPSLRGTFQVGRRQVFWMVNPIWSNDPADVLYLSAHNGVAGRPSGVGNEAEVRTFITHFPTWVDSTDEAMITDVKVRYNSSVRFFPEAFNEIAPPHFLVDNEGITTATVESTPGFAHDYSGFMIQDSRVFVSVGTDGESQTPGGVNGIGTISQPTAKTYNARSFTHDVTYDGTAELSASTGLVDIASETIRAAPLTEYLNGRTLALAPIAVDTDYADMFAVLRKLWYETSTLDTEFPVRGVGTTLIFDGPFQLVTTAGDVSTSDIRLPITDAAKTLTGDITTWDFSTHTNDWSGNAWPTGVTISGGFHDNIGTDGFTRTVLAGVTWTAINTPTIRMPTSLISGSFEDIFGDVTGGFNIELAFEDPIEITATQAQQEQILNRANFVGGTGTSFLSFTRFVDVAEFDQNDNKQVHMFNALGEFLVTLRFDSGLPRLANTDGVIVTSQAINIVDGHFRVTETNIAALTSPSSFDNRMLLISASDISIPQIRYIDTVASASVELQFVTDPSIATSANDDALTIVDVLPAESTGEYFDGVLVITEGFGSETAAQSKKFASDVRNTSQYAQWISAQFDYANLPRDGTDLSNQTTVRASTADFSASSFFEVPITWRFQPNENGPVSLQSYSIIAKTGTITDLLEEATVIVPASDEAIEVDIKATLNTPEEIDYSRVNLEAENAARTAIDGTIMNMVDETHNASNYLLTNGVDVDGGGGYDRLIGIKPRAANFNPTRNY